MRRQLYLAAALLLALARSARAQWINNGGSSGGGGGGDTITSPNGTLTIGGTSTNTTADLSGKTASACSAPGASGDLSVCRASSTGDFFLGGQSLDIGLSFGNAWSFGTYPINLRANNSGYLETNKAGTTGVNVANIDNTGTNGTLQIGSTSIDGVNINAPTSLVTYTVSTLPATCAKNKAVEVSDWNGSFASPAACSVSGGSGTVATIAICQASNVWNCL